MHFHVQEQLQVVLRGSGTLGRHVLQPGSVHYTSPQPAYGPIVAVAEGPDYFTLRVLTAKGAWYLPEARPYMTRNLPKHRGGLTRGGLLDHWKDKPCFASRRRA